MSGICYLVGTPIGNLKDITLRALEVLKEADVIAAEDTRHSRTLLHHYGIRASMISCRAHNERACAEDIKNILNSGKTVAIVTDAGMPGISDPGAVVVRVLREAGCTVRVVPGASAAVAAVSLAAPKGQGYAFLGFLPEKKKERDALLESVKRLTLPLVFYCAPHDLDKVLAWLRDAFGNRGIFAVKELTKLYETVYAGTLDSLEIENKKGEFVLIVEPAEAPDTGALDARALLQGYLAEGSSKSDAAKRVAKETGLSKNEVYALSLEKEEDVT